MVIFKNKKNNNMEEKQLHLRHFNNSEKLGTEKSSPSTTTPKEKPPLHNFEVPGLSRRGNQRRLRCIRFDNSTQKMSNIFGQSGTEKGSFGAINNNGSILAAETRNFCDPRSGFCGGGAENDDCGGNGLKWKRGWWFGSPPPPPEKRSKVGEVGREGDDIGISAVRERVILDLQNAGDKMKEAILGMGTGTGSFDDVTGEVALGSMASPVEGERVQPWNSRTRRATNQPVGGAGADGVGVRNSGVKNMQLDVMKPKVDALKTSVSEEAGEASRRRRRRSGAATPATASSSGEKERVEKFSVALGRREIEEDFMALVGHKPPRRPKKRAKNVQKQLDTLFPGLWLTEITADMYKVTETG